MTNVNEMCHTIPYFVPQSCFLQTSTAILSSPPLTCRISGIIGFELLLQPRCMIPQPRVYGMASSFLSRMFLVFWEEKKCHYHQFILTDWAGRLELSSFLLSTFLTLNCLQCQYQPLCLLTVTVFGISRGWVQVARSHRLTGRVEKFPSLQTTGPWRKHVPLEDTVTHSFPDVKALRETENKKVINWRRWCSYRPSLMITSKKLCVDAITLPTFGSQACSLVSVFPCPGMQPAYQLWIDGCSLERDCLSGYVRWGWQQDPRTAAWGERKWASTSRVVRRTVSEIPWNATNHKAPHL